MQIRRATPADARAVEEVRVAGWKVGYAGIVPASFLDAFEVQDKRVAWLSERFAEPTPRNLVAVDADDVVIAMSAFGPARDDDIDDTTTELYALYVDPRAWRIGIGSALLVASLDARPAAQQALWVLEGNVRGRAFYERHGFRTDGAVKERDLDGPVTEVRYRRP